MNLFLVMAFLFFIGSCSGWVLEVFYRRFFSASNPEHKWLNPGFLTGPCVPLYGFGVVILYLFCRIDTSFIPVRWAREPILFLGMGIAMTLIELLAGVIFIIGMHVKLWDYSDRWANYRGLICPLFSLIWTGMGVGFYYVLFPVMDDCVTWLEDNLTFCFVVGIFYGILLVDLWQSLKIGARIRKFAAENDLVVRYESFKLVVRRVSKSNWYLRHLMGEIHETPFFEYLREYREKYPAAPGAGRRRRAEAVTDDDLVLPEGSPVPSPEANQTVLHARDDAAGPGPDKETTSEGAKE